MSKWIDVNEKLPEVDQRVMVYFLEDEPVIEIATYLGEKSWYISESYVNSIVYQSIKFWQPLPYIPYGSPEELQAIESLKSIAENPCLCDLGCPRCDAIESLQRMNIKL